MDFERLQQYVLRLLLQELEFRNESDVYVLWNFHTKPAWWYVGHESIGLASRDFYESRGLENVVSLIEQLYPDFYAWLFVTFHRDMKTQQ